MDGRLRGKRLQHIWPATLPPTRGAARATRCSRTPPVNAPASIAATESSRLARTDAPPGPLPTALPASRRGRRPAPREAGHNRDLPDTSQREAEEDHVARHVRHEHVPQTQVAKGIDKGQSPPSSRPGAPAAGPTGGQRSSAHPSRRWSPGVASATGPRCLPSLNGFRRWITGTSTCISTSMSPRRRRPRRRPDNGGNRVSPAVTRRSRRPLSASAVGWFHWTAPEPSRHRPPTRRPGGGVLGHMACHVVWCGRACHRCRGRPANV